MRLLSKILLGGSLTTIGLLSGGLYFISKQYYREVEILATSTVYIPKKKILLFAKNSSGTTIHNENNSPMNFIGECTLKNGELTSEMIMARIICDNILYLKYCDDFKVDYSMLGAVLMYDLISLPHKTNELKIDHIFDENGKEYNLNKENSLSFFTKTESEEVIVSKNGEATITSKNKAKTEKELLLPNRGIVYYNLINLENQRDNSMEI